MDGEYNAGLADATFYNREEGSTQDLLTLGEKERDRERGGGEFMRRFALAGGFTRDEKPKFLSLSLSPFLSSLVSRYFPPQDTR